MKRRTYAEIESELTRLDRLQSLNFLALNLVMHQRKPDAVQRFKADGSGRCVLRLYGARRADGGIVVDTFHCPGQSPLSTAHYLEDLTARIGRTMHPIELARAVERLTLARNQLIDNGSEAI